MELSAPCAFLPFQPLLHFWNVIRDIFSWVYGTDLKFTALEVKGKKKK